MSVPVRKNPIGNTTAMRNGAYLELGILVGRLYNLGESSASITGALRTALDRARKDGVGQEG
jgi:hypothetical protein